MHTLILAAALLATNTAAPIESPPDKADIISCMGHAERASSAAITNQDLRKDVQNFRSCSEHIEKHLSTEQTQKLIYIQKLLLIQLESPSMLTHGQIAQETMKFVMQYP